MNAKSIFAAVPLWSRVLGSSSEDARFAVAARGHSGDVCPS